MAYCNSWNLIGLEEMVYEQIYNRLLLRQAKASLYLIWGISLGVFYNTIIADHSFLLVRDRYSQLGALRTSLAILNLISNKMIDKHSELIPTKDARPGKQNKMQRLDQKVSVSCLKFDLSEVGYYEGTYLFLII